MVTEVTSIKTMSPKTGEVVDKVLETKEVAEIEKETTWISVIYVEKQIESDTDDLAMSGIRNSFRQPMLRNFQYYDLPTDHKEGEAIQAVNFSLHPGSNVGLLERLPDDRQLITRFSVKAFKRVFSQPMNLRLLQTNDPFFPTEEDDPNRLGFIRVLIPDYPDDIGEPGYRHFNDAKAALLIKGHMHGSWIKRALAAEKRPNIQLLAEQRIARLIEIEQQLQSGV